MIVLPSEYVSQYIYQYVGYVKEKRHGILNGGCPFCHEGDSWGKKSRFYYNPDLEGERNTVYCHNCGYTSTSINFIKDVSGLSYKEIIKESEEYDVIPKDLNFQQLSDNFIKEKNDNPLPLNSINLFDKNQIKYHKDNKYVRLALKYIIDRKIHAAPNRPKALYISLDDYVHKNRLIIPYYESGKIIWYQTRRLIDDGSPKYLSKVDSDKSLFNVDNIDQNYPYIFIFEGAIDAMFVENATCVSGITEKGEFTLTEVQERQFSAFPLHKRVWILDSPYKDKAARDKSAILFSKGELVFKWPENIGQTFKDFNEIIVNSNKTKIPQNFILRNLMNKETNYMKLNVESLKESLNKL